MLSETVLLTIGLGCVAALLVVALFGAMKRELKRISAAFGAVPMVVKALFLICGVSFYLHGSLKTNNTTKAASTMMFAARPSVQTTEFINQTEMYVNAWNATGVWQDSFWCRFENDFVFPFGTNHLKGVEVLAWGEIWSTHRKDAVLAELGEKVAIGRGISQFDCEYIAASETNEAKYVYSWYICLVNRETNSVVNGRIELRRSGDILVATNGVERFIPRQLPFVHNGFGQDSEWVAANFTNAEEILSVGYSQWVDDQVGVDLTNGLYKLTVTVPEKPLETTQLMVGDYSIAVTNAGEYVFLLEKGVEYQFTTWPFMETAVYNWTDDLENNSYSEIEELNANDGVGVWTEDGGVEASYPTKSTSGVIVWMPRFKAWPDVVHLTPGDFPLPFIAILSDCRLDLSSVQYQWVTSDSNINIVSPTSQETLVDVGVMPKWDQFDFSVTVKIANRLLCSTLQGISYGVHEIPMVSCSVSVPRVLILKDKQMDGSKPGTVTVAMLSDIPTNGVVRISLEDGEDKISTSLNLPQEFTINEAESFTKSFLVDGILGSDDANDVKVKCEFINPSSERITTVSSLTVLNPLSVTLPQSPSTGTCVVKNIPVSACCDLSPVDSLGWGVEWYTAKRRNDGGYDNWQLRHIGGVTTFIPTPEAGVFALKARIVSGTQSNETVFVHMQSEGYCAAIKEEIGPCEEGKYNHFGVARSEGLLRLRNVALSHLGRAEYGKNMFLESKNGYASVKGGSWKCNRFVADVAIKAGFSVPHNKTWMFGNVYPPVANDWSTGNNLPGWIHLGSTYPEPGFIAGRYKSPGPGHCGVVDYDGWTISARPEGIGRNAEKMLDGTIRYNKPEE